MLSLEIKRFVRSWGSSELATDAQAADTCTNAELIAGGKNPLFRRFSITYQHKETCVTLIVKDTLTKNGMATRVLCHDGLIADGGLDRLGRPIDRGIGEVHTLLRICEQAVKDQMGYCVQLELKPLTPKSGGSFEAYVDNKWPAGELLDAPEYDKKLGQVQDCEFAEHLIAAKHGQLFKQRKDNDRYSFWSYNGSCWVEGWSPIGGWCTELFDGCPYGASAAGIKRIRDYMTLACPELAKDPIFNQVPNGEIPCAGGIYYSAVERKNRPIPLEHYVTKLWACRRQLPRLQIRRQSTGYWPSCTRSCQMLPCTTQCSLGSTTIC
mmetsp:Transcript_18031/g.44775  ORF Transcript_18031/g.44775 Transcript_18031/m.44775 type:complete len:323 (+) Transcript_18031:635-1603(+)